MPCGNRLSDLFHHTHAAGLSQRIRGLHGPLAPQAKRKEPPRCRADRCAAGSHYAVYGSATQQKFARLPQARRQA